MPLREFILGPVPHYDPETDDLSQPIEQEEKNLPVHVELCARRYTRIMSSQTAANKTLYDLKALIINAMLVMIALTKGGDFIEMLSKF